MFVSLLALLAETTAPVVESSDLVTGSSQSVLSLLWHANIVVQLTMLLLVAFSVFSWAIIGSKRKQLKRSKAASNDFIELFMQSNSVAEMVQKKKFKASPALSIFKSGIDGLRHKNNDFGMLEREVRRSAEQELEQLEYCINFLATTASAAPFIGLFGTVWGILNAFWKIGQTGASSLAVVGPHIAEALIATAIGLAAAIPAVIFYNIYVSQLRSVNKQLEFFCDELLARLKNEYFSTKG